MPFNGKLPICNFTLQVCKMNKKIQPGSMSLFKENDIWLESTPNPCILPVDIMVKAHSSREITVYWAVKTLDMRQRSDQLPLGFHIVVEDTDYQKTIADVYTYQYTVAQYRVPAHLEPGHRYRVQVTVRTFWGWTNRYRLWQCCAYCSADSVGAV